VNNSLSAIRSALSTQLNAVSQLKQVVQGRNYDATGFPLCRFYLIGVNQENMGNAPSDWRTYRFAVEIVQEASAKTPTNAEADFQDAVEAVMNKLSAQWQLSLNCEVSMISQSQAANVNAPFGPAVVMQLIYEVKTVIQ